MAAFDDILSGQASIRDEGSTLSHRCVTRKADRLCASLRERGISPGDIVAIDGDRGSDALVAVLGVLRAGAAFLCLDPNLPRALRERRLASVRAKLVLGLRGEDVIWEAREPWGSPQTEGLALRKPSGDTLAYVVFTSGTTGDPKAVGITRAALQAYIDGVVDRLGGVDVFRGRRVASVSSLSVDLGYTTVFPGLAQAGEVLLPSLAAARDPAVLGRLLSDAPVDILKITPTHLREALRHTDVLPKQVLILGGEPLTWDFLDQIRSRAPDLRIFNHYGPAETCVGVAARRVDDLWFDTARDLGSTVPIGEALAGISLRLVPIKGREDGVGEIEVEGPTVPAGYLSGGGCQSTDGFHGRGRSGHHRYRTGDLARHVPSLGFRLLGRADRQVKIGTVRVEPAEVESVLRGFPAVIDCAVAARPSPWGSPTLIAWVVASGTYDEGALRAASEAALVPNARPAFVIRVDSLPISASGKVDVAGLPSPTAWETGPKSAAGCTALRTLLHHANALFGFSGNDEATFLSSGMQSLDAMRLIHQLRQDGWHLEVGALFGTAKPSDIARTMTRRSSEAPSRRSGLARQADVYEQSLWFASRVAVPKTYDLAILLDVESHVGAARIAIAWNAVLASHPAVRLRIVEADDLRLVYDGRQPTVEVTDSIPTGEAAAMGLARALLTKELDPKAGRTTLTSVIPVDARRCLIPLLIHHVACDGSSVNQLMTGLSARLEEASSEQSVLDTGAAGLLPACGAGSSGFAWARDAAANARADDAGCLARSLPPAFGDTLTSASEMLGVTRFTFLLAAWGLALSTLTPDAALLIATPVDVRGIADSEAVGCFVNTVLVEVPSAAGAMVTDYVAAVQRALVQALGERATPFGTRTREVRTPGPRSLLTLDERFVRAGPTSVIRRLRTEGGGAMLGIDLVVLHDQDGWQAILRWADEEVSHEIAGALLDRLERVVRLLAARDATTAAACIVPSPESAAALLAAGCGARMQHPFRGLADGLLAAIEEAPGAHRLRVDGRNLTLADLDIRSRQWVAHLTANGILRGSVAAVDLQPGLDQLAALFALARVGAIPLPIDPAWPLDRKRRFAAAAEAVIADCEAFRGALRPPPGNFPAPVPARHTPVPEDVAYMIGTSGSTGEPKILPLSHGSLANHFAWMQRVRPLGDGDVALIWTTPCFDVGIWERFAPLATGASAVVLDGLGARDLTAAARAIVHHRVTLLQTTPTLLRLLLQDPTLDGHRGAIDVFCGGEALEQDVVELTRTRLPDARLHDAYGPAETTIDAMVAFDAHATDRRRTFSSVVDNMSVAVLDSSGRLCDLGEPGQLAISGWQSRPPAAGAVRTMTLPGQEGRTYVLPGDRAHWRAEGVLVLHGRSDRCVKLNGERIELDEIEAVLTRYDGVDDAAVVLREGEVTAYVVAGKAIPLRCLASHAAAWLPRAGVPTRWARPDAMPRTASGKIDRGALLAMETLVPEPAGAMPSDEVQRRVAGLWTDILHRECSLDEGFFEAGGDSLLLLRLRRALEEAFGVAVTVPDLFAFPSVRLQAELVRGIGGGREGPALSDDSARRTGRQEGLARLARRRAEAKHDV